MGPLSLLTVLCLASPVRAQRVEKVELNLQPPGSQWSAPTLLQTPQSLSLLPVSLLTVPALTPSPLLAPAPYAPARIDPATLRVVPSPQVLGPVNQIDPARGVLKNLSVPTPGAKNEAGGDVESGRLRFDGSVQTRDPATADVVPAWPGKTGDVVRVAGVGYVLGEKLGEGTGAKVYRVAGQPELAIKLVNPGLKSAAAYGYEPEDAALLEKASVSQSRVLARSEDGLVLVKEYVAGPTAKQLLDGAGLDEAQASALGRFAAPLVKAGLSADLKPANLVWGAAEKRWTLIDSGGVRKDSAADILGYFFIEDWRDKPVAGAPFLSAVRSALGAGSAEWRKLAADGPGDPLLEDAFTALSAADAARPSDHIPYPPRSGDVARIDGKEYALGAKFSAGENAFVFAVKDQPGVIVKILKDGAQLFEAAELPGLALLAKTDLPHSKLVASAFHGRAMVKEFVPGETVKDIRERGGSLSAEQKQGLADFVVALIKSGHGADLNAGNLVWREDERRWSLIDAGLFKKEKPWQAMGSLFYRDQPGDYLGADALAFIEAVKRGLGADSEAWKNIAGQSGKYPPVLKKGLKTLADAVPLAEALPLHPAPGERVVIAGVAYVLGGQIGAGHGSNGSVFRVKERPGLIIKFPIAGSEANVREAANLKLLDTKKIAHTGLVAASADGSVLVKTFAEGETGRTILDRGPLSSLQLDALADFAADLVRAGISPDVKPANLVWDAAGARWILIDGGNLGPAGPEEIIEWMLHPSQLPGHASVDRASFLKMLRARLAR